MNWLAQNWGWIALVAFASFLITQIAGSSDCGGASPGRGHHEGYDSKSPSPSVEALSTDAYKNTLDA